MAARKGSYLISIHALTRSATRPMHKRFRACNNFNPRTHEECDLAVESFRKGNNNFNPRTHEECDFIKSDLPELQSISIHALTRSATIKRVRIAHPRCISIHALTRSATAQSRWCVVGVFDFNPRTHEECDALPHELIHPTCYFNPRTHEECD